MQQRKTNGRNGSTLTSPMVALPMVTEANWKEKVPQYKAIFLSLTGKLKAKQLNQMANQPTVKLIISINPLPRLIRSIKHIGHCLKNTLFTKT